MDYLHPISFSIPEEKVVTEVPKKSIILANYNPTGVGSRFYKYDNEKDYYNGYQKALFAITRKKGGWDCMRHYEILANGCIPYFENLQNCPLNRLTHLPKELLLETNKFYEQIRKKYNINNNNSANQLSGEEMNVYNNYIEQLIAYTRNNLTTVSMAKYLLNNITCCDVKRILYLCNPPNGDYLRCLTLHGLKQLFNKECQEYPFLPHIYNECEKNRDMDYKKLHGYGFSYTKLLDYEENYQVIVEDDLINKIENNYYDIVIYSSMHKEKPNHRYILWDVIEKHYLPEKIIFLCGEDEHRTNHPGWLTPVCLHPELTKKGHRCFVREI